MTMKFADIDAEIRIKIELYKNIDKEEEYDICQLNCLKGDYDSLLLSHFSSKLSIYKKHKKMLLVSLKNLTESLAILDLSTLDIYPENLEYEKKLSDLNNLYLDGYGIDRLWGYYPEYKNDQT